VAENPIRVGVVSDTHGLVRPQLVEAMRGSDLIVHAGDIGGVEVLEALRAIAPLHAVRGNNDRGAWAEPIPVSEVVSVAGRHLFLLHDIAELDLDPEAAELDAVITGHSHRPEAELRGSVLFLNPGSAGPRRFTLPITAAELLLYRDRIEHRHIQLQDT